MNSIKESSSTLDWGKMFPSRTPRFASPLDSYDTPSSSLETTSIPVRSRGSPYPLRRLDARDLDQVNATAYRSPRQREPFRIPRPVIDVPTWVPDPRVIDRRRLSPLLDPSGRMLVAEQPFYQIAPPSPVPIPVQYQILPIATQRSAPKNFFRRIQRKKYLKEKSTGLCATFCSGGCGTFVVLVYLICILALPACKLALGIVYRDQCPVNRSIPLYMMVAGGSGLAMILFLLLSSGCTHCRASIKARKSVHPVMVCTIGFARGMQGVGALFLFVWFIFGNVWVFGVHYRVRTDSDALSSATERDNYCHPALYWVAFYALIFTYVFAVLICFFKFFVQLFCCGACDVYKRALS